MHIRDWGSGMLSDLAILARQTVKGGEFDVSHVKNFWLLRWPLVRHDASPRRTCLMLGHILVAKSRRQDLDSFARFILCNKARIKLLLIREQLRLVRTTDTIILYFFLEETVRNQHLKSAATKFHQYLLSHIQAINERRIESLNELNNLQNSDQKMKRGILLLRRLRLWTWCFCMRIILF